MATANAYGDAYDETLGTGVLDDTETVLDATYAIGGDTNRHAHVYMDVETIIGSESTITAATLYWYHLSYALDGTENPPTAVHGSVGIWETGTTYDEIASFSEAPSVGWNSSVLNDTEEALVMGGTLNGESSHDTEFQFLVASVASPRSRKWEIAAYENTGGGSEGDWVVYLDITYTAAGGAPKRAFVIGV